MEHGYSLFSKTLLPSFLIQLRAFINAGDWILCKNPRFKTQQSVAFVSFNGFVGEKLEFASPINGTIWVGGLENLAAFFPSLGLVTKPDEIMITEFGGHARTLQGRCEAC